MENNYPELLGQVMIINAPLIFTSIFGVIKGWLDEPTRKKVQILGYKYQEKLFKYCDAD